MKLCKIEGCELNANAALGLCWRHYSRVRYNIKDMRPGKLPYRPKKPIDKNSIDYKNRTFRSAKRRFLKYVSKKENGCWEWIGRIDRYGYGRLRVDNNPSMKAHRLSWIIYHGLIPKGEGYHGTCVCHTCDNRKCVNPDHLWLGSNGDNQKDRKIKIYSTVPASTLPPATNNGNAPESLGIEHKGRRV